MPTGIRFRLFKGEPISACPACGRMVARIENPSILAEAELAEAAAADPAPEAPKPKRKYKPRKPKGGA